MDVACYHSVGVNTSILYNGTPLNKALLLDWPVTLCVHLLDLLQPHNFQCLNFSRNMGRVCDAISPRLSLFKLVLL